MESILGLRRRCLCAEFRLKFSNSYGSFIDEDEEEVSAEIGAVAPLSDTLPRAVKQSATVLKVKPNAASRPTAFRSGPLR